MGAKIARKYKNLDRFGSEFNFLLPGGKETFQTKRGATLSLFLGVIMIFYTSLKTYMLKTGKDTEYLTYELDYFYKWELFTSEEGLHIAFALTEYDSV